MRRRNIRHAASFSAKLLAAALLATFADWLFFRQWIGATLGAFTFAWLMMLVITAPAIRRRPAALLALAVALLMSVAMLDDPGMLDWALFWAALSSAAILARRRFDDALRWAERLLIHVSLGLVRPVTDLAHALRVRGPGGRPSIARLASILALPVIGGAVFIALFAGANPLIADLFARLQPPSPGSALPQLLFAALVFVAIWPSFRPHPRVTGLPLGAATMGSFAPDIPLASISLSLITFNAIFAVQNAMDVIFLWSGAPLPGTITMADYAHRGAYSLIATALLAGLFVLVVLRPGSESARRPTIRLLVILWVAQNLLLVASSILRTLDYIASYSLTELRIAAIAWMGLLATGLLLILWRMLANRSSAWLINANALAGGLVLIAASLIDLGATAAQWNVRHAREAGGPGMQIDLCYLRDTGAAGLLPLIELEGKVKDPVLLDRIRAIRSDLLADLELAQSDWHAWTWRGARRLDAARAALGPTPTAPKPAPHGRSCGGEPFSPPPPPVVEAPTTSFAVPAESSEPLTPEPR